MGLLIGLVLVLFMLLGCGGSSPPPGTGDSEKEKLAQETEKSAKDRNSNPTPPNRNLSPPPSFRQPTAHDQKRRKQSKSDPAPVVGSFQPENSPQTANEKNYRPPDSRPKHDAEALAKLGIRKYTSKHLKLYTDIEPALAKPLPKLVDQLYAALEEYFGPLPPDREGRVFQMTGYIMADQRLFRQTELLPENLRAFNHGRHRKAEFWMNDQKFDYYRRHLMLHEATHCFMTITKQEITQPPVWYMEGMAELFGTHRIAEGGKATFRVMPDDKEAFAGLGRITLVQTAVDESRFRSLDQVFNLTPDDYSDDEAYAWSWAMCKFLDTHPRYRERFRELGEASTRWSFLKRLQENFLNDAAEMRTEWALFAHNLDEGYQIEPAAIAFQEGKPLTVAKKPEADVTIKADRGWQSTGVLIEQGKKYRLTASGKFTLAQKPKPWISRADGISFRYFDGRPLGQLLGCLRIDDESSHATASGMRRIMPLGSNHSFIAQRTGTLYLRLNDDWSQLADNTGNVRVEISLEMP